MPPEARILGLGFCLPEEQVANEALSEVLGLDPGDILARCGIAIRHRAADGDGPSELARRAADAARAAAGWAGDGFDGAHCFTPEGERIGMIHLPEICANLCFGGTKRNRLFMCGSSSLYAVYVETQGSHIC